MGHLGIDCICLCGRADVGRRIHVQSHLDSLLDLVLGCIGREYSGGLLRPNFFGFGRIHGRGCLYGLQRLHSN